MLTPAACILKQSGSVGKRIGTGARCKGQTGLATGFGDAVSRQMVQYLVVFECTQGAGFKCH